eukprot:1853381-Amphidinium_carterae.2
MVRKVFKTTDLLMIRFQLYCAQERSPLSRFQLSSAASSILTVLRAAATPRLDCAAGVKADLESTNLDYRS